MTDLTHLPPEEQETLAMVERFCAAELAPRAAATDESGAFVHEQLAAMGPTGLMGANLPEEWGGPGLSAPALLEAVAMVAGACASTASALTAHYLATDSILLGGDDAAKARWLPDAAEGRALGAFGLTEPDAGSDPADMRTRATRTENGWHIKGRKVFISNGGVADFVVVYAMSNPEAGHRGISAFVVPKDTPGLTPGRVERTLGLRGGHVWELTLDLDLPADALLGAEGTGFRTAMKVLDNGRIEVAAMCLGIARAALAEAQAWSKTRIIGGEPLAQRQGIRWQLADMALDLRASELLARDAAAQREAAAHGGKRYTLASSMAKLAASEMAFRVADAALQIHGGYGYTQDFPLERHLRDLRIMRIYEGSSEIQRNIIAGLTLA